MSIVLICLIIVSIALRYPHLFILFLPLIVYFVIKNDAKKLVIVFAFLIYGILLIIQKHSILDENIFINGIVTKKSDNYVILTTLKGNFYIYHKNNNFELFDIIKVNGYIKSIDDTSLEGEFSFKNYLYGENVEYQLYIKEFSYLFENPLSFDGGINQYLDRLNDDAKYIVGNIIFNKSYSNYDNLFNKLGISYLLSFSSIYIYITFNILNSIIKLFSKKIDYKSEGIAILLLIPLLIISKFKLNFIKTIILLINKYLIKEKLDYITILNLLLIVILFINHNYVYSLSFLYLFVLPYLRILLSKGIKLIDESKKKILEAVIYSLLYGSVNIIINGSYNLFLPVVQFVSVILFQFIFILSLLSLIISPITYLINIISTLYIKFYSSISNITLPLYFNIKPIGIIIAVLLLVGCYFIQIGMKIVSKYLLCAIYLILGVFASPIDSFISSYIVFINVVQGDATLIHYRNIDILIDTGGSIYKDIGNDVLIPYLKRQHIYNLDYLIVSHNDFDHNGGVDSILYNFKVDNYLVGNSFEEINIDNLKIKNLNKYNYNSDENDGSSVLYFKFLDMNFLLMGDCSTLIEKQIMLNNNYIDVDVLKLGHHGSNSSSSLEFLQYLLPKEAIISCGVNNKYYHPHSDVINRLNALGIKIRRTDKEGSIKYSKSI